MKKILYKAVLISAATLALSQALHARWWIFGKSKDDVDFDYLYINEIALDETEDRITLFRETLPDGMIYIRGRARSSGRVGAAEISLDGMDSWVPAEVSERGVFEYSFEPRRERYNLYVRVTETTGETNEVERTGREILISREKILRRVQRALEELAGAYSEKDSRRFMSMVSRDFAGGEAALESALRKDFSVFSHTELRLTPAGAAADSRGRINAVVNYVRSGVSARDGRFYRDDGVTELVFEPRGDGLDLYSMKHPLIFGLSQAGELASGKTGIGANRETLIVTPDGDIKQLPFEEALDEVEGIEGIDESDLEEPETVVSGEVELGVDPREGFIFSTGEVLSVEHLFMQPLGEVDLAYFEGDYLTVHGDVTYQFLPPGSDIDTLTRVPDSGYGREIDYDVVSLIDLVYDGKTIPGSLIAFRLRTGHYAVIQVADYYFDMDNEEASRFRFRYKYQSDGSRSF